MICAVNKENSPKLYYLLEKSNHYMGDVHFCLENKIFTNCETLETFADTPERWLDVSWGEGDDSPEAHVGRLNITFQNEPGALGTLSTVIGSNGGNIMNLKITSRTTDFWEMLVDIYVNDTQHLNNVIAALRATTIITNVERAKGR